MRFCWLCGLAVVALAAAAANPAGAQERPGTAVEGAAGWSGFVDESAIRHTTFGAAARFHLTPRVSVGPEFTYMIGPGQDRDTFLLGNVYFDVLAPREGRAVLTPFLVAGAGLFRHRDVFPSGTFVHSSGTFVAGAGIRIPVADGVYIAPDARVGTEDLHMRLTVNVGVTLPR